MTAVSTCTQQSLVTVIRWAAAEGAGAAAYSQKGAGD